MGNKVFFFYSIQENIDIYEKFEEEFFLFFYGNNN